MLRTRWALLASLWRNLLQRPRVENDLSEEIRAHLDLLIHEKTAAGMDPEQARREALLELGGAEQVKEQVREIRSGFAIESLVQDIRQAFRRMKATPGSTAIAVLMLALGIGATTFIFSVFYSVLLRPLPFSRPDRLVQIWETRLQKGWKLASFTDANFWDIRRHNRSFEDMGAFDEADWNMTDDGEPEHLEVGRVSSSFFRTLGVSPVVGRIFSRDEDQPGHQNGVVLLQNRFWRRRFHADPGIVGKTLRLDGRPYAVIGVLPAGEPWLNAADVFVPLVYSPQANRGSFEESVVGRLKDGVSIQAATDDLQATCNWLGEQYAVDKGMGVTLAPATRWVASEKLRLALCVLLGAVGFLLLIACVNLANLLIAKASAQARELTLRAALGATRGRIIRMVVTESLLLGLAGAALGLLLANSGLGLLKSFFPESIPRIEQASLNGWVLGFTLVIALGTGIASGLIPALQAASTNVASALREGDRSQTASRSQFRLRNGLVMLEVALSLVLLVGAGLLIRSFGELLGVDSGFQTENRLVFQVNLPSEYERDKVTDLMRRYLATVDSLPQVIAVAAVNVAPVTGGDPGMGIGSEGGAQTGSAVPWASWRFVSPRYFETMGIPLLQGRTFTDGEQKGKPWRVVISKKLAELLWPGENALGRTAILWKGQGNERAEVIGIARDIHERGLDSDSALIVYIPYYGALWNPVEVVVHTKGSPMAITSALRSRLAAIDPSLPISDVRTMDHVVAASLSPQKLNLALLALFAGFALLLALTGIYGVLAFSVSKRTAEIGVRLALGAHPREIVQLIVAQGMRPILLGICVGLAGVLALSRFLAGLLFQVKPADPITYICVALLIAAAALLSCLVPAYRASRVDLGVALRRE